MRMIKGIYLIQAKSRYDSHIHILKIEIEKLRQTEKETLQKLKEKMEREKKDAERNNQVKMKSLEKEKVKNNYIKNSLIETFRIHGKGFSLSWGYSEQECIPVGCVPPAAVAVGEVSTSPHPP